MNGKNIKITDLRISYRHAPVRLSPEAFSRLCKTTKRNGQTECLHVLERPDGKYEVLKGQWLLRALRVNKVESVVCYVYDSLTAFEKEEKKPRVGRSNPIYDKVVRLKPKATPIPVNRDKSLKKVSKPMRKIGPVSVFPRLCKETVEV